MRSSNADLSELVDVQVVASVDAAALACAAKWVLDMNDSAFGGITEAMLAQAFELYSEGGFRFSCRELRQAVASDSPWALSACG